MSPFRMPVIAGVLLCALTAADALAQRQTVLSGDHLIVAVDQNVPLVFFPATLPVKLTVTSATVNDATVTGTFGAVLASLGKPDPVAGWHRRDDDLFLDAYGDYYFETEAGAVKVLLLSPNRSTLDNVITFFDWYCRNSQIGPSDVGVFGEPVLRKLFYSADAPNYACGESTAAFNALVSRIFGLATRQVNYYGAIGPDSFWGHTVSEVSLGGRWIFLDSLFNVMAKADGHYLSMLDMVARVQNGQPVELRHVVPKDVILGRNTTPTPYDYRHWYAPERVRHVHIGRFIAPEMIDGVDYCHINTYYGFDRSQYVSLKDLKEFFY